MASLIKVTIHQSQFPENIRRDLLDSLRSRQVNHKFHYDSVKQTQKWLALHQAYSPSRNDPGCAAVYESSFAAGVERIEANQVHLVGLGCGGGQKDSRLAQMLQAADKQVHYTPSDVSTAMVLVAYQRVSPLIPAENCHPLVCDLASAEDLPVVLGQCCQPEAGRLVTFFGMIPNFEPQAILPRLAGIMRQRDHLLFSANLAPGADYETGVKHVLPQYDNLLTRDWLMAFLTDLGVDSSAGEIRFRIEANAPSGSLKRIAAYFHFTRAQAIQLEEERFEFRAGETIRLFFSYRYTPALVESLLSQHGLRVLDHWIAQSGEEGVFLCCRS